MIGERIETKGERQHLYAKMQAEFMVGSACFHGKSLQLPKLEFEGEWHLSTVTRLLAECNTINPCSTMHPHLVHRLCTGYWIVQFNAVA